MIESMDFSFWIPTRIILGQKTLRSIGELTKSYGKKALVVTYSDMAKMGMLDDLVSNLRDSGVRYEVCDNVEPNPKIHDIEEGAKVAREKMCDVVIGLGGGSAIDQGKAIAVAATHEGSIWDYIMDGKKGEKAITASVLPLIAVPTTAGTGSEVTSGGVISNIRLQAKCLVESQYLFPKIALIDPTLTLSLPPNLTACTGMDALIHSIESFVSTEANPISDLLALKSIELVGQNLRKAYNNGEDIEARSRLALAAVLGGMAINNAGVGAVHALSLPLGSVYEIGHGLAVAMLLADVIEYNLDVAYERYAVVAEVLGENVVGLDCQKAARRLVDAIRRLNKDLGINQRLRNFMIKETDISHLAQKAQNPDMTNNPKQPTVEEISEIYLKIL